MLAGLGPAVLLAAALGLLLGGLIGLVFAVVVGLVDGLVLAFLWSMGTFGLIGDRRRGKVAFASGLTSAAAGFALFDLVLGANQPRWLSVYMPVAVTTCVAVASSLALEPMRYVALRRPRLLQPDGESVKR